MITTTARRTRATVAAYVVGLVATFAAIAHVAIDQLAVHSLDRHLHDLYDPVGKYGEPGPLYAFLYGIGVFGVLGWLWCLRLVRRSAPNARKWCTWLLAGATVVVAAPVTIQEYGSPVVPYSLMAGLIVAWIAGFVGTAALWSGRDTRP